MGFTKKELKNFGYILTCFKRALKAEKFIIKDWQECDGYFVEGDCYRTVFKLKGLEEFLFGAWLTISDGNYKIRVFAQAENYIDKFKPSYSHLLKEIALYDDIDNLDAYDEQEMLELPRFIQSQPYLAWYRDVYGVNYNLYYISPEKAKEIHDQDEKERLEKQEYRESVKQKQYEYIKSIMDKSGLKYRILDRGIWSSPFYVVVVEDPTAIKTEFHEYFTQEQMSELAKMNPKNDLFCQFFDRYILVKKQLKGED